LPSGVTTPVPVTTTRLDSAIELLRRRREVVAPPAQSRGGRSARLFREKLGLTWSNLNWNGSVTPEL
jgi:hypothetical protein